MKREGNFINVIDTTCRDGMHAIAHQFTPEMISKLAEGLEQSGANYMEVAHGCGLGGSTEKNGLGAATDSQLLQAARNKLKNTKLMTMILPGYGSLDDLKVAAEHGVDVVRVTTLCTKAETTRDQMEETAKLGMTPFGVLMMSHLLEPDELLAKAKLMQDFGAKAVYMMDSSGYMMPEQVRARVSTLVDGLDIPVGFHAHTNLQMHMANTLVALECSATYVDATLTGLGAGPGNTQTEVLAAVLHRMGYDTSLKLHEIEDVAELLRTFPVYVPPCVDKTAITIGFSGTHGSTYTATAKKAAKEQGVDARDILAKPK